MWPLNPLLCDLWTHGVTLTLSLGQWFIWSANHLSVAVICDKLFENPPRGQNVTEQTQIRDRLTDRQPQQEQYVSSSPRGDFTKNKHSKHSKIMMKINLKSVNNCESSFFHKYFTQPDQPTNQPYGDFPWRGCNKTLTISHTLSFLCRGQRYRSKHLSNLSLINLLYPGTLRRFENFCGIKLIRRSSASWSRHFFSWQVNKKRVEIISNKGKKNNNNKWSKTCRNKIYIHLKREKSSLDLTGTFLH